jgi:two-component system response regulator FixJ
LSWVSDEQPISSHWLFCSFLADTNLKPIICIVEDDIAVRESLKLVLEVSGYSVEEFETGHELLARGDFAYLACIVMDVNLPGESGLQTLERLRNQSVTTPVFIVTARADDSIRRESKRLNAAAFFEKPVLARALLEAIGGILAPAQ